MACGPIELMRKEEGLEKLVCAAQIYRASTLPKPFGMLQRALREAKHLGASCDEARLVLRQLGDTNSEG